MPLYKIWRFYPPSHGNFAKPPDYNGYFIQSYNRYTIIREIISKNYYGIQSKNLFLDNDNEITCSYTIHEVDRAFENTVISGIFQGIYEFCLI